MAYLIRRFCIALAFVAAVCTPSVVEAVDKEVKFTNIEPGAEFVVGTPKTVLATHKLPKNAYAYIFLRDRFGHWYIQAPRCDISGNELNHDNVLVGEGITRLIIVKVNAQGDERLRSWIRENRFGAISEREVKAVPGFAQLAQIRITAVLK